MLKRNWKRQKSGRMLRRRASGRMRGDVRGWMELYEGSNWENVEKEGH